MKQILESGSLASIGLFNASQREPAWQNFVSGVSSCTQTATSGHTLDCLRRANSSDIAQGLPNPIINSSGVILFDPTLDGPNGFIPDYPSKLLARGRIACVPFIAGTNLDEGEEIFSESAEILSHLFDSSGTGFTSRSINSKKEVYDRIVSLFSPPIVAPSDFDDVAQNILRLYPDIPALGSPFDTGNETFGLSSVYKQTASIR